MSETRERRKARVFRIAPGGIAFKADASDGDGIVNVVEP